jgi:hypothetical protein
MKYIKNAENHDQAPDRGSQIQNLVIHNVLVIRSLFRDTPPPPPPPPH